MVIFLRRPEDALSQIANVGISLTPVDGRPIRLSLGSIVWACTWLGVDTLTYTATRMSTSDLDSELATLIVYHLLLILGGLI